MTRTPILAALVLALAVSGCDHVEEDYDLSNPLPPSVSFTTASLTAAGFSYDAETDQLGSRRNAAVPAADPLNITVNARLPAQLHHPQTGLGEDVTVQYSLGGDAEWGVDFDIRHPQRTADGQVLRTPDGIVYGDVYERGVFQLPYVLEPTNEADTGELNRFRIRILPTARAGRTLRVELVSASVPSGREITVGRIPGHRDRVLTVNIVAP